MPVLKFSASANAAAATSITIPLGGTPAVGDFVLAYLLTDNEIITHQPGWATEFTANPNPWFKMESIRDPNNATLTGWYHTWNASDSGSSVTFTFVPAPSLGIGDKDVSTTNAVAVVLVFFANNSAVLEHNGYGTAQDLVSNTQASPLKLPGPFTFHAVAAVQPGITGIQDLDPLAASIDAAASGNLYLAVYETAGSPAGYAPQFFSQVPASIMIQATSVKDGLPQLYNPPYIEEAPMGMNALMARYRMNRFFTVLNNAGTFSAQRYQSTDQIAAATQVFVNNQPITTLVDRSNILLSGVGGDFRAVP